MTIPSITFCYAVGGAEEYYDMMRQSIKSLEKCTFPYKVLVLDASSKFKSDDVLIKVVDYSGLENIDSQGNIYSAPMVSLRYQAYKHVDTEVGVYIDVDTILHNQQYLLKAIDECNLFTICRHWWVPTLEKFINQTVVDAPLMDGMKEKLNIQAGHPFIASGVFIFRPKLHAEIFQNFQKVYDMVYTEGEVYKAGFADETLLTLSLDFGKVNFASGALNHCVMGHEYMPLTVRDGKLFGKNPYDEDYEPIVFMHCDLNKRDPSKNYSGVEREIIRREWGL